jgi:protein SCO1/2/putative membrane protein
METTLPDWVRLLPAVNASLNGLATVLLVAGYAAIRSGRRETHKALMLSAFAVSIVFLGCYLAYHWGLHHYTGESGKKFAGVGWIRPIYFTILITHVILAAAVPVLAIITMVRGLREQWPAHRKIARITFPIWLYVSVTGVVIYGLLYHWPVEARG